jgi:hypothetical protein
MFRGRGKQVVAAAGASVLLAVTSLAIVPLVASASGTGTATSVTAAPAIAKTGAAVTVTAQVSVPVTSNADIPTGTVTFTITGHNASTVNCKKGNVKTISASGKATCSIAKERLLAAASPYSIEGVYSGDSNFAGSSGSASETVTPAKTSMTLTAKPTKAKAGQGNDFTATLKAGAGGSLLSGNVVFSVSDSPATPPAKRKCVGGDSVAITVKKGVGTAKCVLDAGWYGATSTSYDVTASFGGNSNFTAVTKSKAGT